MLAIVYAVITVLAWGTWLAPSQNVPFKNQQIKTFYVAIASLVLSFFVTLPQGFDQITLEVFWPPFIGGLIWAVSGYCACTATSKIGLARAYGIWSPLNIVVSLFWGATIFNEFLNTGTGGLIVLIASVTVIISGVLLIIFAKGRGDMIRNRRDLTIGVLGAIGAGILWGSYFIPIKQSDVSLWIATFPLTIGIFVGSTVLMLLGATITSLGKA